ncbi:hypothetical protein BFP72_11185 [Reichenbachiella sp. 5M10]|uniref:hypothetical protein n=1 Tax=Reichenbachiella sp. 5M10 TaxID=1889772 RepID=UPI000C15FFF9|nr:hypothetical protein [Reichenbachiella sp. 5M10]PIB35915.1 hypothetical protein BFP72_11185 [Reichenbachiella sp. 5M10]
MKSKKSFLEQQWDFMGILMILGVAASPVIIGGIWLYQSYLAEHLDKYFVDEPIAEKYCYCATENKKIQLAKLHFRAEDAQKSAILIENGNYDNVVSNRVKFGDKVLIYRYYGTPTVAKVKWVHNNFRGEEISNSGWVPAICLNNSLPDSFQ